MTSMLFIYYAITTTSTVAIANRILNYAVLEY